MRGGTGKPNRHARYKKKANLTDLRSGTGKPTDMHSGTGKSNRHAQWNRQTQQTCAVEQANTADICNGTGKHNRQHG